MGVLVIHYTKILREIEDHMTALSNNTIEDTDDGLEHSLYRSER